MGEPLAKSLQAIRGQAKELNELINEEAKLRLDRYEQLSGLCILLCCALSSSPLRAFYNVQIWGCALSCISSFNVHTPWCS